MTCFKSILMVVVLFASSAAFAESYTYAGKFNGVAGVLTLQNNGQTYAASFIGNNGQNGLLKNCESSIGRVLKHKEKDGALKKLIFAFNPNYCVSVEGREVVMDFKNSSVNLSILSHVDNYQPPCFPDQHGHMNCPMPGYSPVYFTGKFTRQ